MFFFSKIFRRKKANTSDPEILSFDGQYGLGADEIEDEFLPYTQPQKGIPVLKHSVLIANYEEKIKELRLILGLSKEVYDDYVVPVFHRYILFADLLPASQFKHHSASGGLIEHAFQCAYLAARKVQLVEFPKQKGGLRSDVQRSKSQWQVATVIASFLHDAGKVTSDMLIHNGLDKKDHGYLECSLDRFETINDWASKYRLKRYFVGWHKGGYGKHLSRNASSMSYIIKRKTQTWIKDCIDGNSIYSAMEMAVSGLDNEHPLSKIVISSDVESVRQDMISSRRGITKEFTRIRVSDIIANIIKHYYFKGDLKINTNGAWLWYIDETLFLAWDNIVNFILDELESVNYKVPTVPDFLAGLLIEEGLCDRFSRSRIYQKITPYILGDEKNPKAINALKVRVPYEFVGETSRLHSLKEHVKDKISEEEKAVDAAISLRDARGDAGEVESSIDTLKRVFAYYKELKSNVNDKPVLPFPDKVRKKSTDDPDHNDCDADVENNEIRTIPSDGGIEHVNSKENNLNKNEVKNKKNEIKNKKSPVQVVPKLNEDFEDEEDEISDEDLCRYIVEELNYPLKDGCIKFDDDSDIGPIVLKIKNKKIKSFSFESLSDEEIKRKLRSLNGYRY